MNWGARLTIIFSLFVAGILFMVFKASRQNIDLVVTDYYEQELKYQGRIDELQRAGKLSEKVKCVVNGDSHTIEITLPIEMKDKAVNANMWLYCIADKKRDITRQLYTRDANLVLPVESYNKGLHEIKLQWTCADSTYYYEQKIFIQ